LTAAAALLLATTWTPAFGAADVVDRTARAVAIASGGEIRVDATIADLTVTAADRADVQIDVERRAPAHADLEKFPVTIDGDGRTVHVSVIQQDEGRDARLKSTIAIAAPASVVFPSVRVFEGRVHLANIRSAADVDVRRGQIDATRVSGRVRLESGIGGIDVRDGALTPAGMMRLRVFNGPLRVRLGERPANARILAVTLNGGITSDIPLTMRDKFGPRFGEATIGSGDPVLSMDVVKGDISLSAGTK